MGAFSKASSMPLSFARGVPTSSVHLPKYLHYPWNTVQRFSNTVGTFSKASSIPLKRCAKGLNSACIFYRTSTIPFQRVSSILLLHFPKHLHLQYPFSVVREVPTLVQFSKYVQYPLSTVQKRFPSTAGTFSK
jgi:hypothetical protein